jgi:hypothetical protein
MTDSWSPSPQARQEAASSFPHVAVDAVVYQFRAYFQDPTKNAVRSRGEWDRRFMAWCARREEQWFADHHHADEEEKWDPVTGMPKNPKPVRFKEK